MPPGNKKEDEYLKKLISVLLALVLCVSLFCGDAFAEDGWTIRNASGKYLNASAWGVNWSRTPLVWQFENGVFSARTMAARPGLFQLISLGYLIDVQLTAENGRAATTTGAGMTASFLTPTGK